MRKYLAITACLVLMASAAFANFYGLPNEVANPGFEAGQVPWEWAGGAGVHPEGEFGVTPLAGAWAGAISSWGGDWGGPLGSIRQVVDETQFPGWNWNFNAKEIMLDFDYYLYAHAADPWRNVGIKVYLDYSNINGYPIPGTPDYVKELVFEQWKDADAGWNGPWGHAQIYKKWDNFQPMFLSVEVEFYVHFAEWSWVGIDNVDLEGRCVPEPSSFLALASGLLGLGGLAIRRRR